ncbi:MAG: hypothetical protein ACYCZJ_04125 [Sulfuriferula sp.]
MLRFLWLLLDEIHFANRAFPRAMLVYFRVHRADPNIFCVLFRNLIQISVVGHMQPVTIGDGRRSVSSGALRCECDVDVSCAGQNQDGDRRIQDGSECESGIQLNSPDFQSGIMLITKSCMANKVTSSEKRKR